MRNIHFLVVKERDAEDAMDSAQSVLEEAGFKPVIYGAVECESGVFVPRDYAYKRLVETISNIEHINAYVRAFLVDKNTLRTQIMESLDNHDYAQAIELVTQAREYYYLELQNNSREQYDVRKGEMFDYKFTHVGCTHIPSVYPSNYKTKTFVVATEAFRD